MNEPMRDVVVLLPGIGGSVLQRDGKDVWAFSKGAAARGLFSLGGSIKRLKLDDDPPDADDLGDGITAPRLMTDLLIPGLWKIDGYEKIGNRIRQTLGVTPGQNYFEFPYDWRRDNRVAARQLARKSHDWLKAWRASSGNGDAKLVLVGHSMGGIVARIFVEMLEGWKDTRVLITFGTPYGGSVNALEFLVNGFAKKVGPIGINLSGMLRSFTSVYQLLPVFRCLETPGGELARLTDVATLPNVDIAKVRGALAVHADIRQTVDANRAGDYGGTGGYGLRPLVGDFQPTRQSAKLDGDRITSLQSRYGNDESGDGTVPKLSAMPHELLDTWTNVAFYTEAHASLQNFDPVLVQLASLLRNLDIDTGGYYALVAKVSVAIDDLFLVGEPAVIRARPEFPVSGLEAAVVSVATGQEVARVRFDADVDDWLAAELGPLPPGDYRITVGALAGVDPVTDLFAVVDPGTLAGG